jgi:hypothetical protein
MATLAQSPHPANPIPISFHARFCIKVPSDFPLGSLKIAAKTLSVKFQKKFPLQVHLFATICNLLTMATAIAPSPEVDKNAATE